MGIIALKAREAFLARERYDYRRYKQLTDEQLDARMFKLPAKPPIWYKLTHLQKVCFIIGAETGRFCFFNDTGCLDGKTLLETDKGPIRIDHLEQIGDPIRVLSNTGNGLHFVEATAPFKKGPSDLFEVSFTSGKKMVVTGRHKFLTDRGFVSCASLQIGESLPRYVASHQQSNPEFFPSKFPEDEARLLKTIQGYLDRYYQCCRPCGEPLQYLIDIAQFDLQQEYERAKPNPHFEHLDDLVFLLTNSLDLPILSSSKDYNSYLYASIDNRNLKHQLFCELLKYQFCISSQCELASIHLGGVIQDQEYQFYDIPQQDARLCDNLLACKSSSDCVINISYLRTDYYYDLHVPIYENYIAEGFCHHNTGKSLLALALTRYFRLLGQVKHVLILSPKRPNKAEWRDELQKHSPKSSYLLLDHESTKEKWAALEQSNDLFVFETYAGLFRLVCTKKENKKGKNKLVPDPKLVAKLCKHFQGFVCDESVNVGNHNALPFRICRQLSKTSKMVITMTGTPFNRDPSLMWAQMYLVDHGYTLGETLGLFRAIFCKEELNFFTGFKEPKFNKKTQPLLNDFIANKSISYPADEGSLPECVPVIKHVSLGSDAVAYYDRFKEQLISARGNFHETKNAFLRMRQISSGFVGYDDDETGTRAKFEFPDNPKLDLLLSIIQSLQSDQKSIVFFDFTYSGERILKTLQENKIGAVLLYGKTKDVDAAKKSYINDPKKRVLVLQNQFGIGLNLQCAKYGFHYESAVSWLVRKQCNGRFIRQHGQHKTVFNYDLVMRNTVDEDILKFHAEGGDLFENIIRRESQNKCLQ
jgi:superfamily II DNA or RNA helicase